MAKESKSIKITNGCITLDVESGDYIVEEVSKNDTKVYNLTKILDDFINVDGVNLQISKTTEMISEE